MDIKMFFYVLGFQWTSLQASSTGTSLINIVVILPNSTNYPFSITHTRPAIDATITKLQHKGIFTKDTIRVIYCDSKCKPQYASLEAFDFYYRKEVNVFFGPVCDYSLAQVARLATIWKIPLLTSGGYAHDYGANKSEPGAEFKTLTRLGPTMNTLSSAIVAFMSAHNWERAKLIYVIKGFPEISESFCYLAASALIFQSKNGATKVPFKYYLIESPKIEPEKILREEIGKDYGGKCDWKHSNLQLASA